MNKIHEQIHLVHVLATDRVVTEGPKVDAVGPRVLELLSLSICIQIIIIFNAKIIDFKAKFIILNTKFINFNANRYHDVSAVAVDLWAHRIVIF